MKRYGIIIAIVVLGACLRLINIGNNPPALSWDEVSIGYNAYSILKTGLDEHGRFLPLDTFIGYGDYKPPFAIYATVPFVAIFGLNEWSVRLPSALFGILAIVLTYLLVHELLKNSKLKSTCLADDCESRRANYQLLTTDYLPLLSALLLAISPWHINLSRGGFEANIGSCLITLGVWLMLKTRDNPKFWVLAPLPWVASIYTFNSSRYMAPLLVVGILIFLKQEIKKNSRWMIGAACIGVLLLIPIVPHLLSKEARLRFTEVNIFSDVSIVSVANNRLDAGGQTLSEKLIHNRRIGYVYSYLLHFFDNFEPKFLFVTGDGNPKFSTQDVGQLYLIEAPLLGIGMLSLALYSPTLCGVLLYWIIAAIIPAGVARETPHALRIANSLPVWQIFIGFGIITLFYWMKSYKAQMKRGGVALLTFLYIWSVTYYVYNYHMHYPREFSREWQYGYAQAINYIKTIEDTYEQINISSSIGRPYMYTLFYEKYDPALYLKEKISYVDAAGFYHVDGFGKYSFIDAVQPKGQKKTVYIGDPAWGIEKVSSTGATVSRSILKTITLVNEEPILIVFEQ